jgi:hypothetical protein
MPLMPAGTATRSIMEALATGRAEPIPCGAVQTDAGDGVHEWTASRISEVVARRRSVRDFARTPVGRDRILALASCAYRADARLWPAARHGGIGLIVSIAAMRVDGIERGLHLVTRSSEPRLLTTDAELVDRLADRYADAAALLLFGVDLDQACAAGTSGYGAALVRCGSAGYAAWLAAGADGLCGCAYGGSHPLATAAFTDAGIAARHMFSISVGPGAS